jgi:methyl-accepting chemotaxis protein
MTYRWWRTRSERGQASFSVVLALITVVLAGVLVNRVAWTAEAINKKAGHIAETATPINKATDAVLNLDKTNELAGSILTTAEPLQGKLAEIVRLANSVDGLAKSINGTASTVDGTAKSINGNATKIVGTAQSIDRGVKQIITNLNRSLEITGAIDSDATNILSQAELAHRLAACVDGGLPGPGSPADGHCR